MIKRFCIVTFASFFAFANGCDSSSKGGAAGSPTPAGSGGSVGGSQGGASGAGAAGVTTAAGGSQGEGGPGAGGDEDALAPTGQGGMRDDGGADASGVVAVPIPLLRPTEIQYLSGRGNDDAVPWDFYCASALANNRKCTGTADAGTWSTIRVPSNWELQGFGTYYYGTDNGFMRGPQETGFYRLNFTVPQAWTDKHVLIVFEGSMTDTDVKINGASPGPTHQGAFYRFKYDVTGLLKYGASNLLEVAVSKESANATVSGAERSADYWVFGGIFRPVYLEANPAQYIDRIGVDARADGSLSVDVTMQGVTATGQLRAKVFDAQAVQVGSDVTAPIAAGQTSAMLTATVANAKTWSAETPNLYRLLVSLEENGQPVHQVVENIGFRTVEVRPGDGVYINGKRVLLRGINRHSFWPSTGRALNAGLSRDDILLLKGMNVNAVRSSHYPPDKHFLDAADAMGLYVLDELAGWQHAYDTASGTPLVQQMVTFDENHPSILFWDNGNEGGWNTALDDDFAQWDHQRRVVLHPQQFFGGIQANHYPNYAAVQTALAGANIFMPTEFLHGLYDGGGGAGLDDYWTAMRASPRSAGGFLWALLDEGVVRTDAQNQVDVKGNQAPDGVTGPFREKEGSYFAIREIWSPVQIAMTSLPSGWNGTIEVENRYDFTDLAGVLFRWQLVDFDFTQPTAGHRAAAQGTAHTGSIAPGAKGNLVLDLPPDWQSHHALLLSADDVAGTTIGQWSFMTLAASAMRAQVVGTASAQPVVIADNGASVNVTAGLLVYTFSRTSGLLTGITRGGSPISLRNGPSLAAGTSTLQSIDVSQDGNDAVINATYSGNLQGLLWRVMSNGWASFTYRYALTGNYDFFGAGFDYPEAQVRSAQWLGKGPYRVWKNRVKGTTFDVYARDYNDAITGQVWSYPEFKGYFANVLWARLVTTEGTIHFVLDSDDVFLRLFTPKDGNTPQTTAMVFPPNNISFLHGIAPIGTKFDIASTLGPQSQQYVLNGMYEATVYLFVGSTSDLPVP
jgi:hypothetical protein